MKLLNFLKELFKTTIIGVIAFIFVIALVYMLNGRIFHLENFIDLF